MYKIHVYKNILHISLVPVVYTVLSVECIHVMYYRVYFGTWTLTIYRVPCTPVLFCNWRSQRPGIVLMHSA
jgi:hypothetical protein